MAQTRKRRMAWAIFLLVFAAAPALGEETADRTLSPYFFVDGGGDGGEALPLKSTHVGATVSGLIADVVVTQVYANEGTEPIHARYVFPGSTRAAVHGLTIRIGDQVVVATIKERERARKEFEAARAEGKSASLLEQQRPNVFTMSVANIMPGDRIEVRLHYTELLVPSDGTYEFVYPAVVGPRYSDRPEAGAPEADRWVKSPYLRDGQPPPGEFDIRVTLSTGLPLQEVSCPSHDVIVDWEGDAAAAVGLSDPSDFGGNRDFILRYRLAGQEIQSGLMLYEGEDESFFLLMVQPPEHVQDADVPPREYAFVLDVSGSMSGFPLVTAKALIGDLIAHLRRDDLFNVVLFAGGSTVLAPSSLAATPENVERAIRVIEGQRGGGSTELLGALETALALPRDERFSRTIVVITDGFVEADRRVLESVRSNLSRANFFSFGIGSSVNRYLIEGMARAGAGEPFVVTRPEEAAAAAERFRRYVGSPVLKDIEVAYEGFDAYDVEPEAPPDLFAERPVVVFGKWRGRPEGEIVVSGVGGHGPYGRTFGLSDARPLAENGALRYLWARTRVARLSDLGLGGEDPDVAGQVTALGLRYSLLTRYTSFIAVVEKVRNPDAEAAREVDQPLPLPLGVSESTVGYAAGPEPEMWILAAIGLSAWVALLGRRRRLGTSR